MTSLGKCPYEFLETITVRDLQQGRLKYTEMALKRLQSLGLDDPDVLHYVKVRVLPTGAHAAIVTLSLMPYGEVAYNDTVAVDAPSWLRLLPAILTYIYGALGPAVGSRVVRRNAARMMEWLDSVASVYPSVGTS